MDKKEKDVLTKTKVLDLKKIAISTLEKNNNDKKKKKFNSTVTIEVKSKKKTDKKINKEEELLNKYLDTDKYDSNAFNFAAAIFNFSYLMFYKLYISSIILMLLLILLKIIITDNLIFVSLYIVICVICGVFFNKYYIYISKYKIKKINEKYEEEKKTIKLENYNKKNLIAAIIIFIVGNSIIVALLLNIKTLALLGGVVTFINSINISEHSILKMNAEEFTSIVEKYNETAIYERENPGEYTYKIRNKKYNFVAIPHNDDEKNIACSYIKKSKKWVDNKKYKFSVNSSTCEDYFSDIFTNYNKDYDMNMITDSVIIINNKGKVETGSYLKYDDVTCKYNIEKHKFKCTK